MSAFRSATGTAAGGSPRGSAAALQGTGRTLPSSGSASGFPGMGGSSGSLSDTSDFGGNDSLYADSVDDEEPKTARSGGGSTDDFQVCVEDALREVTDILAVVHGKFGECKELQDCAPIFDELAVLLRKVPLRDAQFRTLVNGVLATLRNYKYSLAQATVDESTGGLDQETSEELASIYHLALVRTRQLDALMQSQRGPAFADTGAASFWKDNFGTALLVDRDKFLTCIKKKFKADATLADMATNTVDFCGDKQVSTFEFLTFLRWYGPFDAQCLERMKSVLTAEWFKGFLSSRETDKFLSKNKPGTFLIRYSQTNIGMFALGLTSGGKDGGAKTVKHIRIQTADTGGLEIEKKRFGDMISLLLEFKHLLQYPDIQPATPVSLEAHAQNYSDGMYGMNIPGRNVYYERQVDGPLHIYQGLIRRSWKEKYFSLTKAQLQCATNKEELERAQKILVVCLVEDVVSVVAQPANIKGARPNSFIIELKKGKKIYLSAATTEESSRWVRRFNILLERAQKAKGGAAPGGGKGGASSSSSSSSTSSTGDVNGSGYDDRVVESDPTKPKSIPFEELTMGRSLGSGAMAEVYEAEWRGRKVAVKRLIGGAENNPAVMQEFHKEAQLLWSLKNANVLPLVGVCTSPMCLVTELMPYGSLSAVLKDKANHALTHKQVIKVALGTARGMAFLHSQAPPIVHRDLKSPNILLDEQYTPKIADFGVSTAQRDNSTMTQTGTPAWMAPEVMQNMRYDSKVDVYSFGLVLWELLARDTPFAGMPPAQIILSVINQNKRPPIDPKWPAAYSALMERCWQTEPADRPAFPEIIAELEKMA